MPHIPLIKHCTLFFLSILLFTSISALAQVDTLKVDSLAGNTVVANKHADSTLNKQYDFGNLVHDIFRRGKPIDSNKKSSGITIVPNISANPTIGFQIGIKAVAGKVLGSEPNTFMSVAATSASITTKNIIYFYLSHNVFTPGNRWNLQGSLVAAKTVIPDFGMGIGVTDHSSAENEVLTNPDRKGYVLHGLYYNFREKVYKQVVDNLFVGAGVSFEIRRSIENKYTTSNLTPYNIYSDRYGFDRSNYSSNGLLFNIQYTTRDNQNRAYKGIYADAGIRANQTWLGSSKNALLLSLDFRKYWSLSQRNPEHVIAWWQWGSYLLNGALPYFELPGTAKDPGSRSGRGYTVAYFKGTQYYYSEVEYRFPITRNKFLSGVVFGNIQTANNDLNVKLFQHWQPGGGAGLRILFNKATRTNLCLDYAFGNYGARGFFLGLNEAF